MLEEHETAYQLFTVDPVELAHQVGQDCIECRVVRQLYTLDTIG